MNILFTRFPLVSAYGGMEIQTVSLMKEFVEHGHDVEFLGDCKVLLKQTSELGITNHELRIGVPPVTKAAALSFAWRKKKMADQLKGFFKEKQLPNAMFMLSLSEKILLTQWAAKQGVRVFWVEHDRIGRWLTKSPWLLALKKASKHATIICVSELSRKMYIDLGFDASRVVAIPNGIDLKRFEISDHVIHTGSALRVGSIARLSPEKGIADLIDAAALVESIDVTIVGKGREQSSLADRIGKAKLIDRVRMVDHIDDLGAFYASLDIFVLPSSDHDPFGLVAAEAMSMGVATIVTDMCGIAGYLDNGENCVIAKAGDSASLAAAIRSLVTDDERRKRIAAAGKLAAEKLFSVEKMVGMYEELVRS